MAAMKTFSIALLLSLFQCATLCAQKPLDRPQGEKHPMSKLTDREREHIKWAIEKGIASERRIARMLGMSQYAIHNVVISTTGKPDLNNI